ERKRESGLGGGVAENLLQKLGNHDGGGVKGGSNQQHDDLRHGEVALAIERQIDDGMLRRQFAIEECNESHCSNEGARNDKARTEPVILLPLIEQDLQRSNRKRQQS